mgnify:FL=1
MRTFTFKKVLSLAVGLCFAQGIAAQVIDLLPAGVTANVSSERKQDKQKNIVVAGSPEKGYKAFFAASDEANGEELWVTDGTPEGTHMVKDICPGAGSGNPCYLGRLNDKVLFSAYTEGEGQEVWVSDGTEEGTMQLADCYMFGDGDPKAFMQMNEKQAIFVAIDDESAEYNPDGAQYWLWVTDGTKDGTHRVVSADGESEHQANCIFPGKDNTTLHTAYCRVGRRVFFKADTTDGMIGEEVWVTDGTEEGTYLVMDINWEPNQSTGGTCSAGIDNFENYKNEKLFFCAWTPSYGGEPWCTDGTQGAANTQAREVDSGYTESGDDHTYLIKDTHPGRNAEGIGFHAGCFGTGWEVFEDRIWYRGWDPTGGYEIAGTNLQKGDYVFMDIWTEEPSVDHNSFSDPGCIFDGVYMFCAAHGFDAAREDHYGGEMWYTDGKTVQLQHGDWVPGTWSNWIKEQTVAGGSLYWFNETNGEWSQGYGNGLYYLDSKDSAPVVAERVAPDASSTGDMVHTLRNLGGTIIYAADVTHRVYCYKHTKEGWDGKTDMGYMEPDFMTEDEKASIQTVTTNDVTVREGVYTIGGAKVANTTNNLKKGVYVANGRKVVIR